jgi:hypothetical protein
MLIRILGAILGLILAFPLLLLGMLSGEQWHSFGDGFFWQSLVCVAAAFLGLWKRAPKWLCVAMAMVNSAIMLYASFATDAQARPYIRRHLADMKGLVVLVLVVGSANILCVRNCLGGRSLVSGKVVALCVLITALFALSMLIVVH